MCEVPGSIPGISKQPLGFFFFFSNHVLEYILHYLEHDNLRYLYIYIYLLLTYSRDLKNNLKERNSEAQKNSPFNCFSGAIEVKVKRKVCLDSRFQLHKAKILILLNLF